ncbi:MAG: amidase [Chitinophagaceae bacterium]|jgi:amidase|nr:MAG: amidase [Chitinophagaceae bacterium]
MNRRNFIRNGTLAGMGIPVFISSSIPASLKNDEAKKKKNTNKDIHLEESTIAELQEKMSSGALSSRSITQWYLDRIQQIDKNGPALNSVIEINPDAMSIAESMDVERKLGKIRSSLHGIPVLIKDNINSGDKMMTTAGSLALAGNVASKDAFIIKKLRESGAVLLGKTNLSEFANFRSTHSCSGWSSRGGQTKNPYILHRNPSGSSAGSGSAVSANLCVIAIGTETDGSIVSPSSVNGIVGIKPTVGLWSRSGIIPISFTQDTAGPMARTVTDAAILLSHLTGIDPEDKTTLKSRGRTHPDYTKFLNKAGLAGKRLGIEKSFLTEGLQGGNPDVVVLLKKTMQILKDNGATLVKVDLLKNINPLAKPEFTLLQYEFKEGINKYLSTSNAGIRSLAEIIEFNIKNQEKVMPYFKQDILIGSNQKDNLDSKEYKEAWKKSTSSRLVIDNILKQNDLDAVCGATNGLACCIDLINGDYDTGFSFSSPAAMAGYPHITVPMGFIHDLPVGFSFFGTAFSEPALIGMAYAFEQATLKRQEPAFIMG